MIKDRKLLVFPALVILMAAIALFLLSPLNLLPQGPCSFPKDTKIAVWDWNEKGTLPPKDFSEIYLYSENLLYGSKIDLTEYLADKKSFTDQAKKNGIRVQALLGHPNLNLENDKQGLSEAIALVATESGGFKGISFDIEPYNSKSFDASPEKHLSDFFKTTAFILSESGKYPNTIPIGITIPNWYSERNQYPQTKELQNGNLSVSEYLFTKVKDYPNAYIVLMNYRNFTEGHDGSISYAKRLLDQGMKISPNTHVLIGLETTNVEPSKITFYGQSKNAVKCATEELATALSTYPNFKGFVIHNLASYQKLKAN